MVDLVKMEELKERIFEHVSDHNAAGCEICALFKEVAAVLTSAKAEIEGLREALKPFARKAVHLYAESKDFRQVRVSATVGDLRRAAAAYEEPRT